MSLFSPLPWILMETRDPRINGSPIAFVYTSLPPPVFCDGESFRWNEEKEKFFKRNSEGSAQILFFFLFYCPSSLFWLFHVSFCFLTFIVNGKNSAKLFDETTRDCNWLMAEEVAFFDFNLQNNWRSQEEDMIVTRFRFFIFIKNRYNC